MHDFSLVVSAADDSVNRGKKCVLAVLVSESLRHRSNNTVYDVVLG